MSSSELCKKTTAVDHSAGIVVQLHYQTPATLSQYDATPNTVPQPSDRQYRRARVDRSYVHTPRAFCHPSFAAEAARATTQARSSSAGRERTGGRRVGADVGADGRTILVGGGMSVSAPATSPARHQLSLRPRPVDAATSFDEAPEGVFPGGEGITTIKRRAMS